MKLRIVTSPGGIQVEQDGRVIPLQPGASIVGERIAGSDQGRYLRLLARDGGIDVSGDPFGQVDLYYREGPDGASAATSLDLLPVAHATTMDQAALAHAFCVYGNRPPKRHTVYAGVHRLGVGETLRLRPDGVSVQEAPFHPAETGHYTDADLDRYADLLLEAVRARASDNGNIVYLSSGWDSTSILGCLVHLFGPKKVHAIVGRMQYAERSGVINQFEIDRARAIADYYGVPLEVVEFDYRHDGPAQLEEVLPMFRSQQVASLVGLNHARLAKAAQESGAGDTVFAGEISDGAHNLGFSQYVTIFHPVLDFREYSDKMASYLFGPTFLGLLRSGAHATDPVYTLLRGRSGDAAFDAPASDAHGRTRQLLASFFLRGGRIPLWSLQNSRFLTPAGREGYASEMQRTYLDPAVDRLTDTTLYAWYLRLYNSFHWQGSTVVTLPLTAEARGLRAALPFWDAKIQAFLSAMPEHWGRGLDFNRTKYPLKWMLQHRIRYPYHLQSGPHSYLYDVDHSFSHAAELLFGSSFAPLFRRQLAAKAYRERLSAEWFDLHYIDALAERYVAGETAGGPELSDLTSLCLLSMTGWY
jgi:hypothetical protein